MFTLGLTGGIGSGKTAASDIFEELGVSIVDADIVAREVVEPGTTGLIEISKRFGEAILNDDGELNRPKLRERIFANPKDKTWLEELLHPLIREETIKQLASGQSPYRILVSPLLFETDQHNLVDRTLLIDVPEALQIERATARDENSAEQIKSIIAQQMSRDKKRQKADDIVENKGSIEELRAKLVDLHKFYLETATSLLEN